MDGHRASLRLRTGLAEQVLKRTNRYERIEISQMEYDEKWLDWIKGFPVVYVGHKHLTVPEIGQRLIVWDQFPVTDGELARQYLRTVYEDLPQKRQNPKSSLFEWEAPIFTAPVTNRALAYVDIEAAYWQIVSVFRPDDVVLSNGAVAGGEADWIEPATVAGDRGLRHAVVGSIFANSILVHEHGKPRRILASSPWTNGWLKRHCMQVLHAIAGELAGEGRLHSFMTDAAIVDWRTQEEIVHWLSGTWGLRARVKAQGMGSVWSPTTYEVGEQRSMDLVNGTTTRTSAVARPFSNLKRVNAGMVRKARMERLP